jgi:hypothetical protein
MYVARDDSTMHACVNFLYFCIFPICKGALLNTMCLILDHFYVIDFQTEIIYQSCWNLTLESINLQYNSIFLT